MEEALSEDAKWRKLCLETLNLVWKNADAWIFQTPVVESPALPHDQKVAYISQISKPMDLRTVKRNIPAMGSPAEFELDMLLIFQNCMSFNKPGQDAFEMSRDVEAFFLTKWELEQRKLRAQTHYEQSLQLASPELLAGARKQSKHVSPTYDPALRRIVQPMNRGSSILARLRGNTKFAWFEMPVHKYGEISEEVKKAYYAMIQTPMDFTTIERNLNLYPSLGELRKDLELIVTNSVRFNPPGTLVNLAAQALQAEIDLLFKDEVMQTTIGTFSRILPEPCPPEWLPAKAPTQLLRIRRPKEPSEKESVEVSPEVQAVKTPTIFPSSVSRPMTPLALPASDWRMCGRHLLSELNQVKDADNRSLCWILQKPIVKYDLPTRIKRLYCLTVTRPMDLGTIQHKLLSGYRGVAEFEADMQQMLDNCLVFNDEAQYPHKVALVIEKHYRQYWWDSGLRAQALALEGSSKPVVPCTDDKTSVSNSAVPWDELRTLAMTELATPGIDVEHVFHNAPLNSELLYEWRVAQRFVLHEARRRQ